MGVDGAQGCEPVDFLEAGDWRLEGGKGAQCEGVDDFFLR